MWADDGLSFPEISQGLRKVCDSVELVLLL
jgi:hypothetical protein